MSPVSQTFGFKLCGRHKEERHESYLSLSPAVVPPQKSAAVRIKDSAPPLQVRDSAAASMEDFPCKDQTVHSYQQISCLDSVIRY